MISELLRKWFGIEPPRCQSCEILTLQLEKTDRERRELLNRLLESRNPEPPSVIKEEELKPITPQFVPWRVKQQLLEQEDRQRAQLLKDKQNEIEELEKEVGIKDVS